MSILFLIIGCIALIYWVVIKTLVYRCLCFNKNLTNPLSLDFLNTSLSPIRSSKQIWVIICFFSGIGWKLLLNTNQYSSSVNSWFVFSYLSNSLRYFSYSFTPSIWFLISIKISSNISPLSFLLFPAYPIKKWFNFESFGSFFLTSFFLTLI